MTDQAQFPRSRYFWPVALVGAAALLGWLILRSGPVTVAEPKERIRKVVKTVAPVPGDYAIQVTVFGEVVPAQRVVIEPQVSGNVLRVNPKVLPGGILRQGEELFAIDPVLAELDVEENGAELIRAQANLSETERKYSEGRSLARDKVIADTELASLEAAVRIQKAEVDRLEARLERSRELLRRHRITAPFNAVVLDESIDIGQRVSPGDNAVTLAGTDSFRVVASVPVDQLQWIDLPQHDLPGARATVVMDTGTNGGAEFSGEVIQLEGAIEASGRMARVLVRVDDPLRVAAATPGNSLLLGSYVRVEIDAGVLRGVLAIDRPALRDDGRIWVAGSDGRLKMRDVNIRWKAERTIYIDAALDEGESLIVSDLRVALPDLEIDAQPAAQPEAEPELPDSDLAQSGTES